jgi:hypothetical protein
VTLVWGDGHALEKCDICGDLKKCYSLSLACENVTISLLTTEFGNVDRKRFRASDVAPARFDTWQPRRTLHFNSGVDSEADGRASQATRFRERHRCKTKTFIYWPVGHTALDNPVPRRIRAPIPHSIVCSKPSASPRCPAVASGTGSLSVAAC